MENEVRTVKACMATCGRRGRWEGERWLNMELEPWPFAGRAQGSEDGVFCFFFFAEEAVVNAGRAKKSCLCLFAHLEMVAFECEYNVRAAGLLVFGA